MTTRKEARDTEEMLRRLEHLGISYTDAESLRRISMALHRWHEMECGMSHGCVERDETSGKPYWLSSVAGRRTPIADKEAGAMKRLSKLMAKYPSLTPYVQDDPRGASLYILKPGDVPEGADADSYYSRGVAVYR